MKNIQFRPRDDEQKKAVEEYMNENGLNQTEAMRKIVDKALDMENQFAFIDDNPCPLRDYLGEHEAPPKVGKGWYCMKKAPALKILGSGIESAAEKICGKCKIRDEALADSKTLREQKTKGIVFMLHTCTKGAKPNEDMTEMRCPEVQRWRPIMKRTKKNNYLPCRDRGTNKSRCIHLVSTPVKMKGNLPEGQNL